MYFHVLPRREVSPQMRAVQIFLLTLIIIGVGLLLSQKFWVPRLVAFVLSNEATSMEMPQNDTYQKVPTTTTKTASAVIHTDVVATTTPKQGNVASAIIAVDSVDGTKLPLGDGKRSTNPKKGYIFSCQTAFSQNAGGASADGSWIHGTTWNVREKISVRGSVVWSTAWFKSALSGLSRLLSGNGLPVGSHTGTFPVASDDPAYQIDRNPNSITAHTLQLTLPRDPTLAATATCVPMGAIGHALNGVAIFNALDGRGDDAVAHEVQDSCNGHPERSGEYHYHGPSSCIPGADKPDTLVGYALDGFGIFSRFDAAGKEYTDADLDACHGITSDIEWNGKKVTMYHYVLTQEYPYTLGCFRGTPVVSSGAQGGGGAMTGGPSGNGQGAPHGNPPREAITACEGKNESSSCSVQTPQGTLDGTCRIPPGQSSLACVPN